MGGISKNVRLEQLRADADACGPDARALFDRLLTEGKTPEAAAMYACQQAPGAMNTDRTFCDGQRRKMDNMAPLMRQMLQDEARKSGLDTRGKFYVGGPFGAKDARSWATCSEDVHTICKENNLNCEGVINRTAVVKDKPPPKVALAPDIVSQLAQQAIAKDPALRERVAKNRRARQELRESIIDKHTRRKTFKKSNRLLRLSGR